MKIKTHREKRKERLVFEIATFDFDEVLGEDSIPASPREAEPIRLSFGDKESQDAAIKCMGFSWVKPDYQGVLEDIVSENADKEEILTVARKLQDHWLEIISGNDKSAWLVDVVIDLDGQEIHLFYACEELGSFTFRLPLFLDPWYDSDDENLHVVLDFQCPRTRDGYVPSYRFISEGRTWTFVDKGDPKCWRTTSIEHECFDTVLIREYTDF